MFGLVGAQMGWVLAAVRGESQPAVHLVSRPGVELLSGRVSDAPEPLLLSGERIGSADHGACWSASFGWRTTCCRSGSDIAVRHPASPGRSLVEPSLILIVVFGMFYGGVMGTYGGVAGERVWQVVYSAVKVPFLLVATFLLEPSQLLRAQHAARTCGTTSRGSRRRSWRRRPG